MIENFQSSLLQTSRIDHSTLERAERAAATTGERIDEALVKLGLLSEEAMLEAWHEVTGLRICTAKDIPVQPFNELDLPITFMRSRRVLPVAASDKHVTIAVVDPADLFLPAAIAAKTGRSVERLIIAPSQFAAASERLFPVLSDAAELGVVTSEVSTDIIDIERLKDLASDAPVIRIVNTLLDKAIELNASDIHLGMTSSGPFTRFRVDGMLVNSEHLSNAVYPAVVSRLKIMAGLDIAERRLPQDGRIRTTWRGRTIDLRVATSPSIAGEGVVLRILDRSTVPLSLSALGLSDDTIEALRHALSFKEGIVLVTGPTGSGKSTTLYSALSELRSPDRNIITVEDPVEVRIEGINQIPVLPSIGLDFARALRSVLRQDPDVIMIGEIRDRQTADVAVQAALTGHLVLATLHTNSAAATIPRLVDMGVEPFLLASTLRGVLAQRLARRLCYDCRELQSIEATAAMRMSRFAAEGISEAYAAKGCEHCRNTGYRGRLAVSEILAVNEKLQRLISKGTEETELVDVLQAIGWRTIQKDACQKLKAGDLSLEEMLRVLGAGA